MVRLALHMHIDRICNIDSKDEEYFDSLWLPKVFIGCDKKSACTVFKLCSSLHAGMESLILFCGVLAVMAGAFWILHTCLNELNQTEYCSVCGFYDPHLDNDMDNDTEKRKGRGQKRRRKDSQCKDCTKRRRATAEPPRRTRIHTSFVEHVCSDPQCSHPIPIRLLVRADEVHIRPVQDPDNLLPADNEAEPEEEIAPPNRRSRSRSPEASCSRVSMKSPNSYVVEDTPPRPPRSEGGCRPMAAFSLRSAWDSSDEEEEEEEGQVPIRM